MCTANVVSVDVFTIFSKETWILIFSLVSRCRAHLSFRRICRPLRTKLIIHYGALNVNKFIHTLVDLHINMTTF